MDLFSIVYVAKPEEAVEMADAGADAIIAHVGTTVGGSIGVTDSRRHWIPQSNVPRKSSMPRKRPIKDIFFLRHGGPINTPDDVRYALDNIDGLHGFVGASSLGENGSGTSLTNLTKEFKKLT